jgi:hypothetical protein
MAYAASVLLTHSSGEAAGTVRQHNQSTRSFCNALGATAPGTAFASPLPTNGVVDRTTNPCPGNSSPLLLFHHLLAPALMTLKEDAMHPLQVAARFAAYVWFIESNPEKPASREEALRYARDNWAAFIPCAHEGLGRLLLKLSAARAASRRGARRRLGEKSKGSRRRLTAAR